MKRNVIFPLLIFLFILGGCSNSDSIKHLESEKYTVDYIKEHSNITMENKILCIEDNTPSMYENGLEGTFYMEVQKCGEDFSVAYNVSGYEIGLFSIDNSYTGYSVIADEEKKYTVNGDISESTMYKDFVYIKDMMDIDYSSAKVKTISLAQGPSKKETVSENIASVSENTSTEDVVLLTTKEYLYVLYMNPNDGKCNRLQIMIFDEKGNVAEEFFIIVEDLQNEIMYPVKIEDIADVEALSGEEFSELSFNFVFGSMLNTIGESK